MKRLAIFCDGTWNRPENREQTHVERLSFEIPQLANDGTTQIARYFEGVGAGRGTSWLRRNIDQYGGGAFGWGLEQKIVEAYQWLAGNYAPGDEIYIFGFSRGAYTARSLGGLIRSAGVPNVDTIHRIPDAIARYKDRDEHTKPGSDESAAFRWKFSPDVYTGETEKRWREARGHSVGHPLKIRYLGIWDTVGGLGVPGVFGALARPFNARYLFHDAVLSSSVSAGRHALSTDERRLFYPPTVWKNLDALNGDDPARPYRQEWFPGDHGMVGGSGADKQLSEYTMQWIIEGAAAQGLETRSGFRDEVTAGRAFGGRLSNARWQRLIGRNRRAEDHCHDVSVPSLHRMAFGDSTGGTYDPATLRAFRSDYEARVPTQRDARVL